MEPKASNQNEIEDVLKLAAIRDMTENFIYFEGLLLEIIIPVSA